LSINSLTLYKRAARAIATNKLTYRDLIHRIREEQLIPELIDSWRYPVEPLL